MEDSRKRFDETFGEQNLRITTNTTNITEALRRTQAVVVTRSLSGVVAYTNTLPLNPSEGSIITLYGDLNLGSGDYTLVNGCKLVLGAGSSLTLNKLRTPNNVGNNCSIIGEGTLNGIIDLGNNTVNTVVRGITLNGTLYSYSFGGGETKTIKIQKCIIYNTLDTPIIVDYGFGGFYHSYTKLEVTQCIIVSGKDVVRFFDQTEDTLYISTDTVGKSTNSLLLANNTITAPSTGKVLDDSMGVLSFKRGGNRYNIIPVPTQSYAVIIPGDDIGGVGTQEYITISSVSSQGSSITINATSSNTTKTIEYLHPSTNVLQDSNVLTNVPNGIYNILKARLKGSNPSIVASYYGTVVVSNTTTPVLPPLFLVMGNSIQAYGYDSNNNPIVTPSNVSTTPRNRVGDYMFAKNTNTDSKLIVLGYPGRAWWEWVYNGSTLPDGANNTFKNDYTAVINQFKTTHRIITIIAFGENGFEHYSKENQVQDAVTAINYMKSVGASEFLMMPTVNRTDQYSGTFDPNFNYIACKDYYDQYFIDNATTLEIKIAPKTSAPDIYANSYADDITLARDKVHPTRLGNEKMSVTMLDGLKLFSGITFLPPVTSPYLSSPRTVTYTPATTFETNQSGRLTKTSGGNNWNSGGKANIKIDFANFVTGDVCVIEYEEPRPNKSSILFGLTTVFDPADITKADMCFYYDLNDLGIWYNKFVQFGAPDGNVRNSPYPRFSGNPKIVLTRVDANSPTGDRFELFIGTTRVRDDFGKFPQNDIVGYLNGDSTSQSAPSELPITTVTCSRILPA